MEPLSIAGFAILLICSIAGTAAIFFTTFGTFIILSGVILFALFTDFYYLGFRELIYLFMLYILGELMEYLFIVLGAKRMGASNAAIAGAIIGGIVGAGMGTLFLGVGIFIGTLSGIFAGALLVEMLVRKDLGGSVSAAFGAVAGRLGAVLAKVIIALIMFVIVYNSIFHRFNFM